MDSAKHRQAPRLWAALRDVQRRAVVWAVALTAPPDGATLVTNQLTFSATVSRSFTVQFIVNGQPYTPVVTPPYALTLSGLPSGTYTATALATDGMLSRSKDGLTKFESGPSVFPDGEARTGDLNGPGPRHVAVLWVYYSSIGDAPERTRRCPSLCQKLARSRAGRTPSTTRRSSWIPMGVATCSIPSREKAALPSRN